MGGKQAALWKMCKWGIKYTAAPFSQNRLFQRRRSVLKRGGGGGGRSVHLPVSHTHIPTQIFQNALCVVRSLAQANLFAIFTVSIVSVIDL